MGTAPRLIDDDRRMRMRFAVVLFAACGGGGGGSPAVDAYDTARCLIKGDYGALGNQNATAGNASGNTTVVVVLDPNPQGKDDFFLKFVAGKGVFTGGVAPGTYTIGGVDASFNNCGLCTNLIADINPTSGPAKFYFATSGSVTLTTVTPPIQGSAQNLKFVEIDLASGLPIAGGCVGSIGSITFATP
jgi:hypothetical protein